MSNRALLEKLIHRIVGAGRVDMEIKDRFGQLVVPREWFLIPFFIDEAVDRVQNGTISVYTYDRNAAWLVQRADRPILAGSSNHRFDNF